MSNKCFPSLNKTIVSSSDYIDSIRKREKWKGLRKSVANKKSMSSGYGLGIDANGNGAVLTAKSHEDLLDVAKGKFYENSSIVGARSFKNDIWAGSKLYVDARTTSDLKDYSELYFNDQSDYWRGSNSLPLHGFSYPYRVELTYQPPDNTHELPQKTRRTPVDVKTTSFYTYIPDPNNPDNLIDLSVNTIKTPDSPNKVLDTWQKGRYSIK